jgi:hypothetical protein
MTYDHRQTTEPDNRGTRKRVLCRCEQCHRVSHEYDEPRNPDYWFCAECRGVAVFIEPMEAER